MPAEAKILDEFSGGEWARGLLRLEERGGSADGVSRWLLGSGGERGVGGGRGGRRRGRRSPRRGPRRKGGAEPRAEGGAAGRGEREHHRVAGPGAATAAVADAVHAAARTGVHA